MRDTAHEALSRLEAELQARLGAKRFRGLEEALLAEWGDPPMVAMKADEER